MIRTEATASATYGLSKSLPLPQTTCIAFQSGMGDKRKRNSDWRSVMKSKFLWYVICIGVLVLAVSIGALAQNPTQFSGVIDAYSPQTGTTGPYEVHGPWSLQLLPAASSLAS